MASAIPGSSSTGETILLDQHTHVRPRPFLKWAGGKGQLLAELTVRLPKSFRAYHEPFVGSGALFFELAWRGRLPRQPSSLSYKEAAGLSKAYLSDVNRPLIDAYAALQMDVDKVIALLKRHEKQHGHDYYYRVRERDHARLSLASRAARVVYLNRTCYNGLYRENKQGRFNVPFGRYKNPTICDEDNLRAVSRALREVVLTCQDYEEAMQHAQRGDFVYVDPPYHPISRTSSFTSYDRNGFSVDDQCRLRNAFAKLARRGVNVMLSNSDTPLIRELYSGFNIERVFASRSINSKGNRRGKIPELIIRNY